ncbi:MAG: hypothetical protein Q7U98_17245 [Methylicorpusculum sp.]|uniref:hypothetical protein n=1 Tax=Methylicorpusculum sp. TaxID=2713644 RepID=UPI00271EFA47|nr:hypothetical protein [Methylicorpusculum sp.]MDO8940903.1 hypothetical protein [Methylicorpusculum sp.]MDP2202406.1 hypothetical protein [Methylicorpusculum sp.]
MNLDAVLTLRDRLKHDAALTAFFNSRYNVAAKHFIGYRRTQNAADFPSLCYVPVRRKKAGRHQERTVSVIVGLNESEVTDGVFAGVAQSEAVVELIEKALIPLQLGADLTVDGAWIVNSDLGQRHPFYETELQLTLKVTQ